MIFSVYVLLTAAALLQCIAAAPWTEMHTRSNHPSHLKALSAPSQGRKAEHKTVGRHGSVATEIDVCSNVGADLLSQGGSAADAIIGASLCVGSIDAFHSGIGGGGFILVRKEDRKHGKHVVEMIDMRESAPAASNETMYSANSNANASTVGGLAVAIPAELRGYHYLHQRFGKLPWAQLFTPAITINRGGFKVTSQLNTSIAAYADTLMCKDPLFKEVYCSTGTAAKLGDTIKRERLAVTYEKIAKGGPDAFYKGDIAKRTIDTIQQQGGIMTLDDLSSYKAIIRRPFHIDFDGKHRVWSTGAPSSGAVVLSALKTMSKYGANTLDKAGVNLTTHRLIEATKFAYGERTEYADPDFVKNVTRLEYVALTDKDAEVKRHRIKDNATEMADYYDPMSYTVLTDHGTSELAAQDDDGLAVTLTTTVNLLWGSQIMTEDGFILNDEMDDFSSPGESNAFGFRPSSANYIRPGKRPLSSISPVIIEDIQTGRTTHALGCAGGSRIVSTNIINSFKVLQGEDLQAVIDMPRWHDQLLPATTTFEWQDTSSPTIPNWRGFDNSTVAFLKSVGHNVSFVAPGLSTAQGVSYNQKTMQFTAATENRQLSALGAAV